MENSKSTPLGAFQTVYKTLLRLAALILAEYFVMWSLLQYMAKEGDEFTFQKWYAVYLLAALLLYVIFAAVTDRKELAKIGGALRRMCSFEMLMLVLLLLWYIVNCAVRTHLDGEPYFAYNDNRLLIVVMSTFLFFPFVTLMGRYAKRMMEAMVHVAMLIYTPICAYCVYKYYKVEFFYFPSGYPLVNHRISVSMQMGGNLNITAAASVLLFGLSLYMILTKKGLLRLVYVPAALVHYVTVIVQNSRTSSLTLLCVSIVTAFLLLWDLSSGKGRVLQIALSLIAAVLTAALLIAAQGSILKMFAHVYPESNEKDAFEWGGTTHYAPEEESESEESDSEGSDSEDSEEQNSEASMRQPWDFRYKMAAEPPAPVLTAQTAARPSAVLMPQTAARPAMHNAANNLSSANLSAARSTDYSAAAARMGNAEENSEAGTAAAEADTAAEAGPMDEDPETGARKMNNLGGRSGVWKSAVRIMLSSWDRFFFGVSPCAVAYELQQESGLGSEVTHAHNGLLQAGVGLGVPGMLLFLLLEIRIIFRCITIIRRGKGALPRFSWILPVIMMSILITELMEAMVFAMVRLNLVVFYMLAGCLAMMTRRIEAESRLQ